MAAAGTHQFKHFTLRPAGAVATDRLLARQWIEADPFHQGQDPAFWLEQGADCDSYLLLDAEGPLFFWKGIRTRSGMEMHIQFPPTPGTSMEMIWIQKRIKAGLRCGLTWLLQMLGKLDVVQVYFESSSPALIAFATIQLGFTQDGRRLFKRLSSATGDSNVLERKTERA